VVLGVTDVAEIKSKVSGTTKAYSKQYGKTVEVGICSYSALSGPIGAKETSEDPFDTKQMTLTGWGKIDFNWSNSGTGCRIGFYGCRSGVQDVIKGEALEHGIKTPDIEVAGTSFVEKVSKQANLKDVNVAGQVSYSYPSKYTNVRNNSENGKDNFINSRTTKDGVTTINFQLTYLVGGVRRGRDWLGLSQDVAFTMRVAKNGSTVKREYQQGAVK
jgi:hypothetical protein